MERDYIGRQGEVAFFLLTGKIEPAEGWAPLAREAGHLIVGHSETGHHHVIERPDGVSITASPNPPEGMAILRMIVAEPTRAIHLRGHDTHDAIPLAEGVYEIRTPVEYDHYADAVRRVAD